MATENQWNEQVKKNNMKSIPRSVLQCVSSMCMIIHVSKSDKQKKTEIKARNIILQKEKNKTENSI